MPSRVRAVVPLGYSPQEAPAADREFAAARVVARLPGKRAFGLQRKSKPSRGVGGRADPIGQTHLEPVAMVLRCNDGGGDSSRRRGAQRDRLRRCGDRRRCGARNDSRPQKAASAARAGLGRGFSRVPVGGGVLGGRRRGPRSSRRPAGFGLDGARPSQLLPGSGGRHNGRRLGVACGIGLGALACRRRRRGPARRRNPVR